MMKKNFLLFIIIVIIIIFPNILYNKQEVTDSFLYYRIAISKISYDNNVIITGDDIKVPSNVESLKSYPGLTSFIVIFRSITGIDFKAVQFLPISGIILIIVSFAFSRQIIKSILLCIIFVLYISYEPGMHGLIYSVFSHGISMILYFIFLILYFKMQDTTKRTGSIISILVIFLMILLTYYSFEVYMIIFSLSITMVNFTKIKITKYMDKLSMIFIILFLIYDKIFYRTISSSIKNELSSYDIVYSYFFKLRTIMPNEHVILSEYEYHINNAMEIILAQVGILFYLVIMVPIVVLIIFEFGYYYKYRKFYTQFIDIEFAFIFTALLDIIIYLSVGYISFKYILFIFPILTLIMIDRTKSKKIKTIYITIFLILLFSKFILWNIVYIENRSDINKYTNIDTVSNWLLNQKSERLELLTDLETSGKITVESAYLKQMINIELFNKPIIRTLTEDKKSYFLNDYYMIIDYKNINYPIQGGNWESYVPLTNYLFKISENKNLNLIYFDGLYIIYIKD